MRAVAIRLDPTLLVNPDADLRYLLPDLMVERAGGALVDDGYDYLEDGRMMIYLLAESLDVALPTIREVLETGELLGNSLRSAVAAVADADGDNFVVIYPPGSDEDFPLA